MSLKKENVAAPHIKFETAREKFCGVFTPFLPFFLHFYALKRILKTVEAQTFCLNSGRVANAFSSDKYMWSKKCVSLTAGEGINLWVMPLSQLFKNHSFETLDCRSNCQPNPECYCQKQSVIVKNKETVS